MEQSRIVGSEWDQHDPPQETPTVCWVMFGTIPVCVATDNTRPCTAAEFFVYNLSRTDFRVPSGSGTQQEAFVHTRDPMEADDEDEDLGDEDAGVGVPAEGEYGKKT